MALTLQEIKTKLAEQYDEVSLLEMLNIDSYDLVEAFLDRIEDNYDRLAQDLSLDDEDY
jgi:hypothetical protein